MRPARASAEAIVEAPAGLVYAVLADYRVHHPRIMPAAFFSNLEVERGGVGAGTRFHITLHAPGSPRRLRMEVAEPEPGRLLTETDLDTGAVTAFAVEPAPHPARARVRISTTWVPAPGARGLLDRWGSSLGARHIFGLQLAELRRYLQTDTYLASSKGQEP